uniref:Uncharacterized protein n=1 Tax=Enterococcus faecium TaxID=1352 RepID=E3UST0_ENTFC|nr:hypothetical protein pLG1-0027 [Enterococcus faecium]
MSFMDSLWIANTYIMDSLWILSIDYP